LLVLSSLVVVTVGVDNCWATVNAVGQNLLVLEGDRGSNRWPYIPDYITTDIKVDASSVCSRTGPIVWDVLTNNRAPAIHANLRMPAVGGGTALLAAMAAHNTGAPNEGHSIAYLVFPQTLADHHMVIEHCGIVSVPPDLVNDCVPGNIRIYQSWVGKFNLRDWMNGGGAALPYAAVPLPAQVAAQGLLAAAAGPYGSGWFDPAATGWTAHVDFWYAGINIAIGPLLGDGDPSADGSGAAFSATIGVAFPAAVANRGANIINYFIATAPAGHDCTAGGVTVTGRNAWFPNADCVYCYGIVNKWLGGHRATGWCGGILNSNGNCPVIKAALKTALGHVGGICGVSARRLLRAYSDAHHLNRDATLLCRNFGHCGALMTPAAHAVGVNRFNGFYDFLETSVHRKKGKLNRIKAKVLLAARNIFDTTPAELVFSKDIEAAEDNKMKEGKEAVDCNDADDTLTIGADDKCYKDTCDKCEEKEKEKEE